MPELEVLNLGADPHERGLVHGRHFPPEIREHLETYLSRFELAGSDRAAVLQGGHDWARRIKAFDEEYFIEMSGVAEGAELPLEQIAVLNARYELTYLSSMSETRAGMTAPGLTTEDRTDGCTAFAALPEVTNDGGTLLGQNWDWLADIRGRCFVMRVDRPERPNFICMTQAGIVGGMIGLNESGLGLCVNGLISDQDGKNLQQRPFHMRVRDIMNAENMNQALKAVLSSDRNTSGNFLIGHADGEAIDLETAPQKANHIHPTDGLLTHANHFEVWNGINSVLELGGPSTLYRSQRLRRLLEQRNGPVDVDLAKRLFGDHFGHPYAICRHEGDDEPEGNKKLTVVSVILSLNDQVMYASDGPPCENEYQRIPLAA